LNLASQSSTQARQQSRLHLLLLIPALAWMTVLFIYPILQLAQTSFFTPRFSFGNYLRIFSEPVYLRVLLVTFEIGFLVTAITLLLSYPVAYLMATAKRYTPFIMIFVMLPLMTSILVRTYGWMVLLGRKGVINELLAGAGLIDDPLPLLYNRTGTVIGMVHVLMPFMVLPLYSVMRNIDLDLIKAAQNLGANGRQTFFSVYMPLTLPGAAAGCLIVFIMDIGFLVTPALLGGRKDLMIAALIHNQVQETLNWGLASALAIMLLLVTSGLLFVYLRRLGIDRLWEPRA
jgi:ABC-type spermidine/putrescine transport system permease subunit I